MNGLPPSRRGLRLRARGGLLADEQPEGAARSGPDEVYRHLAYVARVLTDLDAWFCLTYGTLLGAVRDGDVIEWDDDFDLVVKPGDVQRLLAVNPSIASDGYQLGVRRRPGALLAVNPGDVHDFWDASVSVLFEGERVGDLYAFSVFDDGVLRRWDFKNNVYWCPRSSFPDYFVQELGSASLRGERFPVPREAGKLLAGIYGEDWRVPYRAAKAGGALRPGVTTYGDRYQPKLHAEISWCRARGWDQDAYAKAPPWPRPIRGAGPRGNHPRTAQSSGSTWWRDLDELLRFY